MQYKSVKGFSGWSQFGFLLAFLGVGLILTAASQFFLLMKILPAGASMTDKDLLMKAMMSPENLAITRASQILGTLFLLFLPAYLWSRIVNGSNFFWLGFNKYINGYQVLFGFLIIFTAGIAVGPLTDLTKMILVHFPAIDHKALALENEYNMQVTALSHLKGWPEYFVGLIIMAFLPAVFEEAFFRGAVQNLFVKWFRSPLTGIIMASVIFSLIHMSIYLFLGRFLLGMVLGLMFYYTKNIWVNITAHFINNTIALTSLFILSRQGKPITEDAADPHVHWSLSIVCAGIVYGLFILLKKYSVNNKARIAAKENLLIAEADPFRSFAETGAN